MNTNIISAAILGISVILASLFFGNKIVQSKTTNRTVTVKGLSEKNVTADNAWWSINAQISANSVDAIRSEVVKNERIIKAFLADQGFNKDEYKVDKISTYRNDYQGSTMQFRADLSIVVFTSDILKVQKGASNIAELLSKGVLINGEKYMSGPKYYFTKFTDIKPTMLAEATKEALKSAEEFAKNSDAQVGRIKRASQGVFRIIPANRNNDNEEFYPEKIVRVVSTIEYYLED